MLFYTMLSQALTAPYSASSDGAGGVPISVNLLWREAQIPQTVLSRIDEYRSWVDKYIWREIEHPLNDDSGMTNTLWADIERLRKQKRISPKFNPFKVADDIYFHGLNPNNSLSEDEKSLVQMVLDYHAKTMYDYEHQRFVDDQSTQYAYYRELEWFDWVKMVMFVENNVS